ncbi:MAG: rRNA maturation RNase YbeY [Candidatus Curtissbacteria bacterium]|nr:rRNA maturation RNase YbeY [Candidatus Curtissbacteria bacterium]
MISVLISSESRYTIERTQIRQAVQKFLEGVGLIDVEVSILVVGSRKIHQLNRDFRKVDSPTDVLSFPQEESRGPDGVLRLGDVVVCYSICVDEARRENKMVVEKMQELVEHGLRHLLGEHHD